MNNLSISAVIPVYNEEEYLSRTMQDVYGVLNRNFVEFEIIFVNDGSTDQSSYILSNFQKEYSFVKILHNSSHQGLAVTLKKGFTAATKDLVFYIDCDLPFDPSFIVRNISLLNIYDIVIGRRNQWDNLLRKVCSVSYNTIIRRLFHLNLFDINIGIKVFKRSILQSIKLECLGSFIDAELLLEAKRKGFYIIEVPCIYRKRLYGYSKTCNISNILIIIFDMLMYYFRKKV